VRIDYDSIKEGNNIVNNIKEKLIKIKCKSLGDCKNELIWKKHLFDTNIFNSFEL
jgi:hypothetical protein